MQQGVKNYITPAGIERLRAELHRLRRVERPEVVATVSWAAGNGDRSENGDYIYGKRRLRQIDGRIRHLIKRLEIAEVVGYYFWGSRIADVLDVQLETWLDG